MNDNINLSGPSLVALLDGSDCLKLPVTVLSRSIESLPTSSQAMILMRKAAPIWSLRRLT
jgi:hypothetical protein